MGKMLQWNIICGVQTNRVETVDAGRSWTALDGIQDGLGMDGDGMMRAVPAKWPDTSVNSRKVYFLFKILFLVFFFLARAWARPYFRGTYFLNALSDFQGLIISDFKMNISDKKRHFDVILTSLIFRFKVTVALCNIHQSEVWIHVVSCDTPVFIVDCRCWLKVTLARIESE